MRDEDLCVFVDVIRKRKRGSYPYDVSRQRRRPEFTCSQKPDFMAETKANYKEASEYGEGEFRVDPDC